MREAEQALWDAAEIPVRYQGPPEKAGAEPQREKRNLEGEFGSLLVETDTTDWERSEKASRRQWTLKGMA